MVSTIHYFYITLNCLFITHLLKPGKILLVKRRACIQVQQLYKASQSEIKEYPYMIFYSPVAFVQ